MTIAMFLTFHFTKETLWELLETTILAVLCSFHWIKSRNKHMDHEKELQRDHQTAIGASTRTHAFLSVQLE